MTADPATPSRVLMTADAVGGVWTYALELARALAPHGVEFTLATMGPPPSAAQRAEARAVPNLTLEVSNFALEWMDDPWADVDAAGDWLLHLADRDNADVVHLNGYVHAVLPFRRPVLAVGHSCVLSWFAAVKGEPAPDRWREYAARVRRGLHAADTVVAPSLAMLTELQRHYGRPADPRVIYNGIPADCFAPADKDPIILAAGRVWDEGKNLRVLRDAAPGLPWPVLIAGDRGAGPAGERIGSHNGALAIGRVAPADLAQLYARAAIFAHPAKYEPFGLAPLEAALSGCALVLADIPSLREVWADAAFFVPPDDPDALATTLRRLIDMPRLRALAGHRALQRARRYGIDPFAARYAALYASLARRRDTRDTQLPRAARHIVATLPSPGDR